MLQEQVEELIVKEFKKMIQKAETEEEGKRCEHDKSFYKFGV